MKTKINPYMNIDRLEYVITFRCTGNCKHCQVGEEINRADMPACIDPKRAAEIVREVAELFDLTSVMTFGGEPLLYPDATCAVHRAATEAGIKTRQLITNGCFSRDERKIADVAMRLREAGVNNLLLSVDSLHQETVPEEPVYAFAQEIKKAGIPGACIYPAWVQGPEADNRFDAETRAILARFADLSIEVRGNAVYPTGNAAMYLAEFFPPCVLDLDSPCGTMPYTDPLMDINSISVNPNGDLMVCGFAIGNLYEEPLEAIVRRYDPHENAAMNAMMTGGLAALIRLAEEKGITAQTEGYYSVCDLCHRVAKAMKR